MNKVENYTIMKDTFGKMEVMSNWEGLYSYSMSSERGP